jgi:ribosomal protein L35AE/L33A
MEISGVSKYKQRKENMQKTINKESIIKIDRRSKNSAYITIGNWVIYIDNSTGEHIIESWNE